MILNLFAWVSCSMIKTWGVTHKCSLHISGVKEHVSVVPLAKNEGMYHVIHNKSGVNYRKLIFKQLLWKHISNLEAKWIIRPLRSFDRFSSHGNLKTVQCFANINWSKINFWCHEALAGRWSIRQSWCPSKTWLLFTGFQSERVFPTQVTKGKIYFNIVQERGGQNLW